jgi:hypothetical protein
VPFIREARGARAARTDRVNFVQVRPARLELPRPVVRCTYRSTQALGQSRFGHRSNTHRLGTSGRRSTTSSSRTSWRWSGPPRRAGARPDPLFTALCWCWATSGFPAVNVFLTSRSHHDGGGASADGVPIRRSHRSRRRSAWLSSPTPAGRTSRSAARGSESRGRGEGPEISGASVCNLEPPISLGQPRAPDISGPTTHSPFSKPAG